MPPLEFNSNSDGANLLHKENISLLSSSLPSHISSFDKSTTLSYISSESEGN
jgi:hypothetical protein